MSKKIVIVGGGVAGLTAGIYAQKNGFESMIVEKNHFAGGNLTGWKRKNCYIDNCVHWLCGSKNGNYLNKLWKEVGAFDNLQLHQSEDFLVSEYNFQTVSLNKDVDKTREKMLEISPDDEKQIEKFIKSTKLITELANKKLFGQLKNYITLFAMYKNKTIKEVASEFRHPLLQRLLTDYIKDSYSIYTLLSAYSSFSSGDGQVPKNGSLKMAENIKDKYLSLGGQLKLNSEVKNIIIANGNAVGIMLNNKEIINGDLIICAVDPSIVFSKLIDISYMPKKLKMTYGDRQNFPIISSFHIAYKVNIDLKIPETFVFESTKPITIGRTNYTRIMIKNYKYGNFTPDNSFVMQVFLLQNEEDYNIWASYTDLEYNNQKNRIIEEITQEIVKRFKKLKENIEFLDCWTPLTYNKYFDAYKGSYMSFGVTKKIKLNIYPYKCPEINNLYFASQWQKIFGGLPNALMNGKRCIEKIKQEHID